MKRCTACGESKALDQFTRKANAPDGLSFRCRDCQRTARQRLRANGSSTRNGHPVPERFNTMVDSRYFGVELEFLGNRMAVYGALLRAGLHGAVRNGVRTESTQWELKTDGSVHGRGGSGLEVTSPKLRGVEGMRQLRIAVEAIKSTGAVVNVTSGLHVHHDLSGVTLDGIKRIARFWYSNQRYIHSLVSPSRRGAYYCSPMNAAVLDDIESLTALNQLASIRRYRDLNVAAYVAHQTVEVRLHQGTLDADKVVAWVQFTKAVVREALEGATDARLDMVTFLMQLGFGAEEREWFTARAAQLDGHEDAPERRVRQSRYVRPAPVAAARFYG